jgi:hypothetical protein
MTTPNPPPPFDADAARKTISWLNWYIGLSPNADYNDLETKLIEEKIPAALTHLRAAVAEVERRDASFNLRWKADMRAIKRWQEAHPGNELTWPDHADLCVWLLEENDRLRGQNAAPGTGGTTGGNCKSCVRCNAGMPTHRVNSLCEECFAEDSDEYDHEAEID